MTSSGQFNAFAASRGEGLHPKLRGLLESAAASPFSETSVRHDGMLQAGPNPASESVTSSSTVMSLAHETRLAAPSYELDVPKYRKSTR
jgi:hypothetical protein